MDMQIRRAKITRQQVIELAKTMPVGKLVNWYEYGIFIQSKSADKLSGDSDLMKEFKEWETASDEDQLRIEHMIAAGSTDIYKIKKISILHGELSL